MRRVLSIAITSFVFLLLPFHSSSQQPVYDLLIEGGLVLDGTGNPWFAADLAISEGKIAAIGSLSTASARRTIEAQGLDVVPGFIDLHSHADEGLASTKTNTNPNMITQGVTTVVVNQDGRSPWPIAQQRANYERQGIRHHQQATMPRLSNDNIAMLINRMIRIVEINIDRIITQNQFESHLDRRMMLVAI